jgi:hypothetical protein
MQIIDIGVEVSRLIFTTTHFAKLVWKRID